MHLLLAAGVSAFHASLLLPLPDNPRAGKKAAMVIYMCLKKKKKVFCEFVEEIGRNADVPTWYALSTTATGSKKKKKRNC